MVSDEALKKLQEQIAVWPMERRFVVQQLIRDYLRNREDLRAYEATRLTPRGVEILKEEKLSSDGMILIGRLMSKKLHEIGCERLCELVEAGADGRAITLPCKVGDTLWVTGRDNVPREMELEAPDIRTVCTDEDNLCMSTCNRKPDGFCAYRLRNDGADIGKTVFLTRKEAEKALEGMTC